MARKKGDHNARRIEIAEAASKVILKSGLARTSLADIARKLGYSTGVLRHYFQDKQELLLFTKNLHFDRMFKRVQSVAEEHEGVARLYAMARENISASPKNIAAWQLLAAFTGRAVGNPALMRLQHQRNTKNAEIYVQEIAELQKNGDLGPNIDAKTEALGIISFIDGISSTILVAPRSWDNSVGLMLMNRHIDNLILAAR